MLEIGTVLQDRYKIEKQIGAGGMGAVYRAVDDRFDNYVAIKETFYKDDEIGGAFEREAHLLNALQHPVLPHVSDYFTEAGGHFLVMQYIEGEDLSELLKREGDAFPVRDVLRWADNLLDALDYLHSQEPPIIHRDLKPQNLKLTARGEVILLDFGLAKLSREDTSGVKSVFGYSRKYSPLEQIQGTGTDARSDLFALGATIYHLATGKTAPDALTRASAIIAGKHDPLQPASDLNPEISESVANILTAAMALNPDRRFVSAKAMRQALEQAVSGPAVEDVREIEPEAVVSSATAVLTPGSPVLMSPPDEEENFPALEAFAAEISVPPPGSGDEAAAAAALFEGEDLLPNVRAVESTSDAAAASSSSAEEVLLLPEARKNTPTVVAAVAGARRAKRSRLWIAAAAAVLSLLCGSFAAFYFANKVSSSGQPGGTSTTTTGSPAAPVEQNTSAPEITQEINSGDEDAPVSAPPSRDVVVASETKNKPVVIEKEVENEREAENEIKQNPAAPSETSRETATTAPAPPPPAQQKKTSPSKAVRRSEASAAVGDGENRQRVVGEQPLPDIESVFTGERTERRESREERQRRRAERRREIDRMSDDDREETLRERRRQRRQRQNDRRPLPF